MMRKALWIAFVVLLACGSPALGQAGSRVRVDRVELWIFKVHFPVRNGVELKLRLFGLSCN